MLKKKFIDKLTTEEHQYLVFACQGDDKDEIATNMGISLSEVLEHRNSVSQKIMDNFLETNKLYN